ncbi:MAG: 4Fe-4S binding protein [Clostridiales Family XIII bacterium]|jgi:epoxyqueuosine reductase QueG|nr:4Fe-4S binding protein [Clostridiales Family XIII bacterium]
MNAEKIENVLAEYLETTAGNYVPPDKALEPGLSGMRIFDDPIVGVCSADDELLLSYRDNAEANTYMLMPDEWLPGATSVASIFLPLSERVRASNRGDGPVSYEWLHGRIEGQECVIALATCLAEWLGEAVIPVKDARFKLTRNEDADPTRKFTSNWSERHVAHAAGLGTFAMPGGVITRKGTAGRLVSIVTTQDIERTPRDYEGVYDYCISCGKCVARCPVGAVSEDMRKDAVRCSAQVDVPKKTHGVYYGCGKCQTAVPCESNAPRSKRP